MKCISWNVNGIRACVNKGFLDYFKEADADIFCIQESKMQAGQLELDLPEYHQYWNYAERKGYSGTALFTKQEPISVVNGIGIAEHDTEGRVITAEFDSFYFVTVYTPNSQNELKRLDYRMEWEDAFRAYLKKLDENKPVIVTGDMNVAHEEIDLKNPKTNHKNAGFTDEERGKMTELLSAGFIDSFRYFRIRRTCIPGGLIVRRPDPGMSAGVLTIFWYQRACRISWRMRKFIWMSWGLTIVRSN